MAQIKTNLQYGVTGSLQTGSIAGDAIDGTKIADDAINSEHLAAGGVDNAHLATGIASSKLTGALPAISGASLTNLSAGKVLQVVNAFTQTQTTSTSGTYADTTLTASITPSSASNKVLVLINQVMAKGTDNNYIQLQLLRGATTIGGTPDLSGSATYTGNGDYNYVGTGFSCSFLDSPNTTSSTTYKTQFKRAGVGSATVATQIDNGASYITLIEIAG